MKSFPISISRRISLALLAALSVPAASAITFGPPQRLNDTIRNPQEIQAVDLDGDGDLDLIVTENNEDYYISYGAVTWWENRGHGDYRRAGELRQDHVSVVGLEDFDGDGWVDLLSAELDNGGRYHYFISKGRGLAGFGSRGPALPFTTGIYFVYPPVFPITMRDIDGDARLDLVVGNQLWRGRGDLSFALSPGTALPAAGNDATPFAWLDVDGNGLPDWVYPAYGSSQILVSRNLGDAGFAPGEPLFDRHPGTIVSGLTPVFLPEISAGECLLVEEDQSASGTVERLLTLFAKRDGTWKAVASGKWVTEADPSPLTVSVHWDGGVQRILLKRGPEDVAAPADGKDHGRISELLVKTSRAGGFSFEVKPLAGVSDTAVEAQFADLDGDGKSDIVYGVRGTSGGAIQWQRGAFGGRFSRAIQPVSQPVVTASLDFAGDLDGDGDVDFLSHMPMPGRASIGIWTNDGHGESFTQREIFSRGSSSWVLKVLETGAKAKILVYSFTLPRKPGGLSKSELVLLTRMPNGKFSQRTLVSEMGHGWLDAEIVDGNFDGIPDLRIQDGYVSNGGITEPYHWYQGLPGLRFRLPAAAAGFPAPGSYRLDVDWDGDVDLWTSSFTDFGSWLENTGVPGQEILHPGPGTPYYPQPEDYLARVRPVSLDFDGDGHPDYTQTGLPVLARPHGTSPVQPLEPDSATDALHLSIKGIHYGFAPLAFIDVDGDGDLDYLGPGSGNSASIELRINQGGLDYSSNVSLIDSGKLDEVDTCLYADVDGDGISDIISMTTTGRLQWYKGSQP